MNSEVSTVSNDALRTRVSLLQMARDGKCSMAWEELLGYYDPFISRVLRGMGFEGADLDDARQQVALGLWKGLGRYDRDPERAKFRTWFSKLIRNTALNILRAKKRQPSGLSLDGDGEGLLRGLADDPEVYAKVEEEWQRYVVEIAMERTREKFSGNAVAIFNHSLAGESVEHIAEKFTIKINTVYILKHRVKAVLLKEIQAVKHDLENVVGSSETP